MVEKSTILVTGGGGFLGRYICEELRKNSYSVRSFSRGSYDFLDPIGVEARQGDIRSARDVEEAVRGCDGVIHSAALAAVWGRPKDFFETNVAGTRNVLKAMKKHKVKRLVYTSSPSVVFEGKDLNGCDESQPYAKNFLCEYPRTKKLAEIEVLAAHQPPNLSCIALRPHLIWGPGDPHFLPRLKSRRRQGKLYRVGNLKNQVDVIFVENAARAHVQALEAALDPKVGGRSYFLGQERPVNLWSFLDQLLIASGEEAVSKRLPHFLAYGIGSALENIYRVLGLWDREPAMTRHLANVLSKSHYFDHKSAQKAFGYQPLVSLAEGLERIRKGNASGTG